MDRNTEYFKIDGYNHVVTIFFTVPTGGSEVAGSKTEMYSTNTISEGVWSEDVEPLLKTRGRGAKRHCYCVACFDIFRFSYLPYLSQGLRSGCAKKKH